jgi:hypothetical protein
MPIIQGNRPYDATMLAQIPNNTLGLRKIQQFTKQFTIGGIVKTNGTSSILSVGDLTTFYTDVQAQSLNFPITVLDAKTFKVINDVQIKVRTGQLDPI